MHKREFIDLHGKEIWDMLVAPALGDRAETEEALYDIAYFHHHFMKRFIEEYSDKKKAEIGLPSFARRVSFLEFKKRFIEHYGQKKWDNLYKVIVKKFEAWKKS